jgi:hypothetical protein
LTASQKMARLTGLAYLVVVLAGPFTLMYVPGKLIVPGDATQTANNILAHQGLYQANIIVGLISELAFIAVVLMLYQLLKDVNRRLALLMVLLIMIDVPLAFLGIANEAATLAFLRGGQFLDVFDKPQRDALAMLLVSADRHGALVSQVFWGLWLLPLGLLIRRSGFLPRLLGLWLLVNGLAYLVLSATGLLWPQHLKTVWTVATPAMFGEMALMLWLLVLGVKQRPSPEGQEGAGLT